MSACMPYHVYFGAKLVINANRLDEARYRHDLSLGAADVVLIFNGNNHYSFAGK